MAIMSYVHEIQTVYHVVQNPQTVLLSEKGAHGVNARCEKVCMLLPQRSQGSTLKNHIRVKCSGMITIAYESCCHSRGWDWCVRGRDSRVRLTTSKSPSCSSCEPRRPITGNVQSVLLRLSPSLGVGWPLFACMALGCTGATMLASKQY